MESGYVDEPRAARLGRAQESHWSQAVRAQQTALCEALERAQQSPRFNWNAVGMDMSDLPMKDVHTLYRAYFMGRPLHGDQGDDDERVIPARHQTKRKSPEASRDRFPELCVCCLQAEVIAWGDQQTMHDAKQHAELGWASEGGTYLGQQIYENLTANGFHQFDQFPGAICTIAGPHG